MNSADVRWVSLVAGCLGVITAAGAGGCDRWGKRPQSDHERLVAETTRRATVVADEAIAAFLPGASPEVKAKTTFSNRRLIEQQDNFALVAVNVERPDPAGTLVRQDWCTILMFQPPHGQTVVWSGQEGAWNCSAGIDRNVVMVQRGMIGWPEAAPTALARDGATPR